MTYTRGWPPTTRVMCPRPVISSASMTPPGPKRFTVPSPVSISTWPESVMTSRRRVKAMQMIRRRPAKENSFGRFRGAHFHVAVEF